MDALKIIWQKAQAGDRAEARRDLIAIVRETPADSGAWMFLALLLEDPLQQADCLSTRAATRPGEPSGYGVVAQIDSDCTAHNHRSKPALPELPGLFGTGRQRPRQSKPHSLRLLRYSTDADWT